MPPVRVTSILGHAGDGRLAEALHHLEHAGRVERLRLPNAEVARRRFRALTDGDTEIVVALPRSERLSDGAVLLLEPRRAIVVQLVEPEWLRLEPIDAAAALELGYHAGNLHWRVRFDGRALLVAVEGAREAYLERLEPFLAAGRATSVDA